MENIISNVIIIGVVSILLRNFRIKLQERKNEVEEHERGAKKSQSLEDGKYVIQYEKVLKIIMTIGVVFFGIIFFVNYATYFWGMNLGKGIDLGTVIFFGLVLLFYVASFCGIVVWRIKVDGDHIYYRNYLGVLKTYTFSDLDKVVVKKSSRIVVYRNKRKIFAIDNNLALGVYFTYSSKEHNVDVIQL